MDPSVDNETGGPSAGPSTQTSTGTSYSDFLPIPHNSDLLTQPSVPPATGTDTDRPTLSHTLAAKHHDDQTGLAQKGHGGEDVVDLGWNETKQHIAAPLLGGIGNEELWLLVRRFNKQMYHVKEIPGQMVPGNLDLNVADDEDFSPDKLRAGVERLYMTVIIGLMGAFNHVARLRSWREAPRTAVFCAAYYVAWAFDFIVPLILTTVLILVVYEPSRAVLFPPAPIALVNHKTGGVQKPKAGVLGSHDSATGAPENHKGEAVEQEASNFVQGLTSIAITSASGKHPEAEPEGEKGGLEETAPDPTKLTIGATQAKGTAAQGRRSSDHDRTRAPVNNAMWSNMRPIMHGLSDLCDFWERFANALSPTPPFPKDVYRIRFAGVLLPVVLTSLFTTSYMFTKASTFAGGFVFFGGPVIQRGLAYLNRTIPHWEKLLELRNTLLKNCPTSAQLTITLLRIGEANKVPLPPPPRITEAPPDQPAELTDKDLRASGAQPPLNATDAELNDALRPDPVIAREAGGPDVNDTKSSASGKKSHRLVNFFRHIAGGSVKTAISADKIRAKTGSDRAKQRLGAVPPPNDDLTSGPIDFMARYKGDKGHVYITTKATIPLVAFSTDSTIEKIGSVNGQDLRPIWSIPVGDITELKKIGGYGWKARILVGWSLGREIADGLEITDRTGAVWKVMALPLRDELFNRLIAIGSQKWEAL